MKTTKWQSIKIGQLGRVVTGKTPPTNQPELYGDIYPFITPTDISDNLYTVETARFLSQAGYEFQSNLLIPPKSVCYTCIASIGKICITSKPSFTNQQINTIIVNHNEYDYRFVYYLLIAETERIKKYASGSAAPIINKSAFSDIDVKVPKFPIQRRIAEILSAYDDLIENNTRRIRILESMAQAIYQEMFGKVDKESLPEGWEVKPFSKLVDIDPPIPVDKEIEKPFIGMNALSETSMIIDLGLVEMRTGNSGAKFQNRDVLFPRITPSVENGKGAFVQFLKEGQVSIGSTEIIVFREKELNAEYVYFLSREHEFRGNAINSMIGASGRQRVQQKCFDSFMVAKPPKKLLEEFANVVSPMFKSTHMLSLKNINLHQTRDLLLPKLVNGEIEVSELKEKINREI